MLYCFDFIIILSWKVNFGWYCLLDNIMANNTYAEQQTQFFIQELLLGTLI